MRPFKPRSKHGPEWQIQKYFTKYLEQRSWLVERMVGNTLQFGVPDLFAAHKEHGTRWIDLKNPVSYEFTAAQRIKWPQWEKNGIGIWIITEATEEQYDKLFAPANWREYWKPKYDEQIEELNEHFS